MPLLVLISRQMKKFIMRKNIAYHLTRNVHYFKAKWYRAHSRAMQASSQVYFPAHYHARYARGKGAAADDKTRIGVRSRIFSGDGAALKRRHYCAPQGAHNAHYIRACRRWASERSAASLFALSFTSTCGRCMMAGHATAAYFTARGGFLAYTSRRVADMPSASYCISSAMRVASHMRPRAARCVARLMRRYFFITGSQRRCRGAAAASLAALIFAEYRCATRPQLTRSFARRQTSTRQARRHTVPRRWPPLIAHITIIISQFRMLGRRR